MRNNKPFIYAALYWALFVIIPFFIVLSVENKQYSSDWPGYLMFYVIFVAPLIFVVPYKMSRLEITKNKVLYILFCLLIPYVVFYVYIAYNMYMNLSLSF
jgi:hypothetical protein